MRILWIVLILLAAGTAQAAQRTIHVFVALADNTHQGIVPVSARLGNGDDPDNNLYWGAAYGVRTYFSRSKDWQHIATVKKPARGVLERCLFQHKTANVLLVADAYQGKEIRRATVDFLSAAGGGKAATWTAGGKMVRIGGGADLVIYAGHNGLMDFSLAEKEITRGQQGRPAMVLCCKSKQYFLPWLQQMKAKSLLLTTNLMAPEAYSIHDALAAWISGKDNKHIHEGAAAYHRYQKCGINAARRLFWTAT